MEGRKKIDIKPQPGPQTQFLETPADIAIYGGAAGGGKTYGLLIEPLRHYHNPKFGGVIFRKTAPQIRNEGGLWAESTNIYTNLGGTPTESRLEWVFRTGMRMKFSHMEYDKDRLNWQGAQIPFIGYDELTHFTELQFFYMLSRNRSMSGVPGYIRATCNPDPDSWVAKFISWFINWDTGYPIPERSGVLRWFIRYNDEIIWGDSKEELQERFNSQIVSDTIIPPKSVTFIPSLVTDNPILLETDPNYLASLHALPLVEREQLLKGNWKIRPAAGLYFKYHYFEIVDVAPADTIRKIRYWDRAATEKTDSNDPDATAGVLMSKDKRGIFYIEDVVRCQYSPHKVEQVIKNTASRDGQNVEIGIEQDPGSAGKMEAHYYARQLAGYKVKCHTVSKLGDKVNRASPLSSQCEAGNVKIVRGEWNKMFLDELVGFPESKKDDQVDAASGAFNVLTDKAVTPRITFL